MTLEMAQNVGGDYTDFASLIAATPSKRIPIVARVVAYHDREPKQGGMTGENFPVTVDILFCGGPRAGEAAMGERLISGAQTATLRGVPNPASPGEPVQAPRSPKTGQPWGPGQEIGAVFEMRPIFGTPRVVLNMPTDEDAAAISAVYAGGQGWVVAAQKAADLAAAEAHQAQVPALQYGQAPAALAAPVATYQAPSAPAPVQPPASVAPAAPALPPGVTPEMLAAFAAMQAQQAPAPPPAPPVGGVPADAPWRQ